MGLASTTEWDARREIDGAERGIDHGVWSVAIRLWPAADLPIESNLIADFLADAATTQECNSSSHRPGR